MIVNPPAAAWAAMHGDANAAAPSIGGPPAVPDIAVVALRTAAFLILAALAILVLLPAALAAQVALAV